MDGNELGFHHGDHPIYREGVTDEPFDIVLLF